MHTDPYTALVDAFAATGPHYRHMVEVADEVTRATPRERWLHLAVCLTWEDDRPALRRWVNLDATAPEPLGTGKSRLDMMGVWA